MKNKSSDIRRSRGFMRINGIRFYEYEISSGRLPEEFDGCRLLHLSDLHARTYGRKGEQLVRACAKAAPDYIMFTGDLFSRNQSIFSIKNKVPMMRALNEIAPLYYVWGNHESDAVEKAKLMSERLAEVGVTTLRNERVRLTRGGGSIDLYGLELPVRYFHSPGGSYRRLPKLTGGELKKLLGKPNGERFNLLLAHTPLPFVNYAEWGADLTLSGHIHGGMVRLFGIGLLSPERKFFPRYTKGVYKQRTDRGNSFLEVSAGLGKFRLNNPEMAAIVVLKKR